MELTALIGTTHTVTLTVGENDLAIAAKSGDLPVLATPRMIALMEEAAAGLLAPHLDEGITTVGTALSTSHDAPSLMDAVVTAEATLLETDGRRFVFEVKAFEGELMIGKGRHERVSVKADRFLEKAKSR